MAMRDLIPWGRNDTSAPSVYKETDHNPFLALHREVNRLFDDVFRGLDDRPPLTGGWWVGRTGWPRIEVLETDTELRVSAEVPGLEEKDVEVLLGDDVLTLKARNAPTMTTRTDISRSASTAVSNGAYRSVARSTPTRSLLRSTTALWR